MAKEKGVLARIDREYAEFRKKIAKSQKIAQIEVDRLLLEEKKKKGQSRIKREDIVF